MTVKTFEKKLIVLSSKRSSHHAFIEGILQGNGYVYDNNITIRKTGELNVARRSESDDAAGDKRYFLASFERAFELPHLYSVPAFRDLEDGLGGGDAVTKVIYLRDPLNTLASIYSAHLKTEYASNFSYVLSNMRHWIKTAQYAMRREHGETLVYANDFWRSENYRAARLRDIGVPEAAYSNRLSKFGGGGNTFFDGPRDAITPAVLDSRFETFRTDETFVSLVREPENRRTFLDFLGFVGDDSISEALESI